MSRADAYLNEDVKKDLKDLGIEAQRRKLWQLLVIFLDNAIKYSPKNTKVFVETKHLGMNTLSINHLAR